MSEMEIRKEGLPLRCEVCHQDDQFNRETSYCTRCAKVTVPKEIIAKKPWLQRTGFGRHSLLLFGIYVFLTLGAASGVIYYRSMPSIIRPAPISSEVKYDNLVYVNAYVVNDGFGGRTPTITLTTKNEQGLVLTRDIPLKNKSQLHIFADLSDSESHRQPWCVVRQVDGNIDSIDIHLDSNSATQLSISVR